MSLTDSDTGKTTEYVAAAGRELVGVLAGGLLGAIAWTVIASETFSRGWSEQDFTEALGELRGAELTDIPRLGLWTGLVVGVVLAVVLLPLAFRVIPGRWFVRALPLVGVSFIAWALWFSPRIGDETSFPGGVFGSEAGLGTTLSYLAAAIGYGMVAGRVYSVAVAVDFWTAKDNDLRAQGQEVMSGLGLSDGPAGVRSDGPASLELTEEGREERRKPSDS